MESIYVAQGRGGLLKVGRSTNPTRRLYKLRQEFKERGDELVHFHPCKPTPNPRAAENTMIGLLSGRLQRFGGREWFYGREFVNAKRAADEVSEYVHAHVPPYVPPTDEELAVLRVTFAAERAERNKLKYAHRERARIRKRIRDFRATVCARIAEALIT